MAGLFQRSSTSSENDESEKPLECATAEEADDWLVVSIRTDAGE